MESKSLLGIYLNKDTAIVVNLNSKNKGDNLQDCFAVTVTDQEQPKIQALASLIAQGCAERKWALSEAAVSIDCSLFMQHSIHSEFTNPKQIASTVKFDTEEILSTDISEVALTFEINSKDDSGSKLTVYTAQKKILSEILLALQQYDFDPITILPDVNSLTKYIFSKIPQGESLQGNLLAMLSGNHGYLITAHNSDGAYCSSMIRTFLVGPKQNRTDILAREIMMTNALFSGENAINMLSIFDSAGIVDPSLITEKTGIMAKGIEIFGEPDSFDQEQENQVNRIDYAIAYGTALSLTEKEQIVNFRDDFSPFMGKKIKTQKALKFTMVSLSMLLIAVGIYFTMNLLSVNRDIKKARSKFGKNYEIVMESKLLNTTPTNTALKKLRYELGNIQDENAGKITAETSISSKLTLVLKAFNESAKVTGLKIKSIDINEKNITISGNVASREKTQMFIDILEKTGLSVESSNVIPVPGNKGDNVNFTLKPKS